MTLPGGCLKPVSLMRICLLCLNGTPMTMPLPTCRGRFRHAYHDVGVDQAITAGRGRRAE
jgi:hypothetical protein